MDFSEANLRRLSNLEISRYAGELDSIQGEDGRLVELLARTPVEMTMIAESGVCDEKLYEICRKKVGRHDSFALLREKIVCDLAERLEPPAWNLLSVLLDGIYVGDPEDVYNLRSGEPNQVMYNLKGIGTKLAEVRFVGLSS